MAWEEFKKMSKRQRLNLTRKAARGDEDAINLIRSFTNEIKVEVNGRLRALRRAGMAYGPAYNHLMSFTDTEYESNRFMSFNELKGDVYDAMLQNEHGAKFLSSEYTTVAGAKRAEKHRIDKLQELLSLPKDFSYRANKRFLKFLGSEEVSASIEQYGTSHLVVQMLWDAYNGKGMRKLQAPKIMQRALTEYLSGRIDFDTAMERIGVKVENYFDSKPTS